MDPIEAIYRREAPYVLATLIRLLGGFELAEEAVQIAFLAAAEQWPERGMPANPRAWLVSAGRFRTIDMLRRKGRLNRLAPEIAARLEQEPMDAIEDETLPDDMLRLIFVCCHPALPADARTALCLREICGLTTEAIAAAFLAKPATIAQRIVRAKARIRDEAIAYAVPEGTELVERRDHVLRVIYLLFSEGYFASSGDEIQRIDLADEAIRLARLLGQQQHCADVDGLLGLMLLQHSRRTARMDPAGDIVLLEDQDRSAWDRPAIREGLALVERALAAPPYSAHTLQAAIAAVHARTLSADDTDWTAIIDLYDLLAIADPGPIVELNRAIAIGMRDGPRSGLALIEPLVQGPLANYKFAHFARADLLRRLGDRAGARQAYRLAGQFELLPPERRFIDSRLSSLE